MITYSSPKDKYGILGNMAGGMPIYVNDVKYYAAEHLYLCGEWSNNTPEHIEVQEYIRRMPSGVYAKRCAKAKYKHIIRSDFPLFRIEWMKWVVWQKALQNPSFCEALVSTGKELIMEVVPKDEVWAAYPDKNGVYIGQNNMGKILMEVREALNNNSSPAIDTDLFNRSKIHLNGVLMSF